MSYTVNDEAYEEDDENGSPLMLINSDTEDSASIIREEEPVPQRRLLKTLEYFIANKLICRSFELPLNTDVVPMSYPSRENLLPLGGSRTEFNFMETFGPSHAGLIKAKVDQDKSYYKLKAKLVKVKRKQCRTEKKYWRCYGAKKRLGIEVGKLKTKIHENDKTIADLRNTLTDSEEYKKSLHEACKNYTDKIDENTAILSKLLTELDKQKKKFGFISEEMAEQRQKLAAALVQAEQATLMHKEDENKISKILELFKIRHRDNLLEGLTKVQKVLLALPKLQGFVKDVYDILYETNSVSSPEQALAYIKCLVQESNEYSWFRSELQRVFQIEDPSIERMLDEIRERSGVYEEYAKICEFYMELYDICSIRELNGHMKRQHMFFKAVHKLCGEIAKRRHLGNFTLEEVLEYIRMHIV